LRYLFSKIAYDLNKYTEADAILQPLANYILTHEKIYNQKSKKGQFNMDRLSSKRESLLFGSISHKCSINMGENPFFHQFAVDPGAIFCLAGMINK
jgi:hypothetical protein